MKINTIIQGDALEVLKTLPDEYIDCCITSPPYWTQRFYGGCSKEIGLEETSEEYIQNLFLICKEIKRVLKNIGTFWLNIDDVYYGSGHGKADSLEGSKQGTVKGMAEMGIRSFFNQQRNKKHSIIKKKDLCLIPERLIIELQKDGWFIRSKIVWYKPNAMPENVNDRPTNDYELLFLITKSNKYYFNHEAIKEKYNRPLERWGGEVLKAEGKSNWDKGTKQNTYRNRNMRPDPLARNCRAVWSINTQGTKYNHVAKFPEELCIKPIKAGCPVGGLILDPFFGAGTTGVVAKKLGRNYIGIELNKTYCDMARKRIDNTMGSLLIPLNNEKVV